MKQITPVPQRRGRFRFGPIGSPTTDTRAFYERLWKDVTKLSPEKARFGAMGADFLRTSSFAVSRAAERWKGVGFDEHTHAPRDLKQVRSLLRVLLYFRKFLPDRFTLLVAPMGLVKCYA